MVRQLMTWMGDFKQIKWNICFEVTLFVKFMGFFAIFHFLLINQNLGTNFGAPKSGYRSQNQPVLFPNTAHSNYLIIRKIWVFNLPMP